MYYGVDIGSTYIKIVGLDKNNNIIDLKVLNTSINPDEMVKDYLKNKVIKTLVATGYGRYMMQEAFKVPIISEIKAHTKGAYYFFNDVRTIIDLGGQDSKIIKVVEGGNFDNFKMNDKCAAGTGKFIEIAASRLQIPLEKFGEIAKKSDKKVQISSMCAVFAESEVISLIASKEKPENIAHGIIESIAGRLAGMAKSMRPEDKVVFTGGGAKNILLKELLSKKLNKNIYVPKHPQMIGAFGAALAGKEMEMK
ncbi:BadF/BadG/BcrA/BcrD ATPase family protein [Caminibacter profundus]